MDGAMQDLSNLGSQLQLDLLRDWPKLAHDRDLLPAGASLGTCRHRPMLVLEGFSFSLRR